MSHDHSPGSGRPLLAAIASLVVLYAVAGIIGLPQKWTDAVVEASPPAAAAVEHGAVEHAADHAVHEVAAAPPAAMIIPFAMVLGAIAVFPLLKFTEHWWESNLHRFYVAGGLGLVTLAYYALGHASLAPTLEGHWPAHHIVEATGGAVQWAYAWAVFANAILYEFIPFIVLLFSLYTISGGVRIEGDLRAHPVTNTAFIGIGGLLASFVGTTGAAMLLIRPLLETNIERKHVRHTVIFFIFVVCNCGGCLLPIGDPPLFLGYLRGVPFLWTMQLWPEWLAMNGALLAIYYAWDHFYCYPKESKSDVAHDETDVRPLRIRGLLVNGPLLAGVIFSVALLDPSKTFPGTEWHPWYYLREVVQIALVGLSLFLGSRAIRGENKFNYHAIVEVAALFCGIFLCMQPALQLLHVHGHALGVDTPMEFFWYTGGLSSVLDNAPTYVVFFETARDGAPRPPDHLLVAISLGAVFMGAMTYIGNGPNFMVKAIAEKSGVRMPSFFGYMAYSFAILLPLLVALTLWQFMTG